MVGILEAMELGGFIEGEQLVPSLPLILEVCFICAVTVLYIRIWP